MAAPAPPPLWQSDALQNISNGQDVGRGGKAGAGGSLVHSRMTYEPALLSEAYRHVRQVTDGRREADLYDLLANTRREETYQPHFPGVRGADRSAARPFKQSTQLAQAVGLCGQ